MSKPGGSKFEAYLKTLRGDVIPEHVDQFYRFMYERQQIWHKRFDLGEPSPWTKDPILREFSFTNVYRELDRGTLYLMENYVLPWAAANPRGGATEMLWYLYLYRTINRVETFEAAGPIPKPDSWAPVRDYLIGLHNYGGAGNPIFTGAHIIRFANGQTKLQGYAELAQLLFKTLPKVAGSVFLARAPQELWKRLQGVPFIGDFLAYEIYCDLSYARLLPWGLDEWANPGPGCKMGLRLLYPDRRDWLPLMQSLRLNQDRRFNELGLNFRYWKGRQINLRNIEHSLCEFQKWYKATNGLGQCRRKFVQHSLGSGRFPRSGGSHASI